MARMKVTWDGENKEEGDVIAVRYGNMEVMSRDGSGEEQ